MTLGAATNDRMPRMKRASPVFPARIRPADADPAAGLRMLAAQIGDMVSGTAVPSLETALDLALAGRADPEAARRLAEDMSERSRRLDEVIGRALLSAPIA